jgi:cytidine deaminase
VAIFHASAKYPNIPIKKIAVSVASKTQIINEPVSPCGGCRQVISEYEMKYDSPISIIMSGETGQIYVSDSIENLLPIMFNKKHLK